mmetsp:Transcript_3273/g.7746  ORF Transcript_3273/g.7746 Transcript_3273/m.7746 type:complete len:217 (-) Transcript_3273:550-1200(-)
MVCPRLKAAARGSRLLVVRRPAHWLVAEQPQMRVAMRTMLLAFLAGVAQAEMVCPETKALVACGMQITATAEASCDDVLAEMKARVAGQLDSSWDDPHNHGNYTVESYGGSFSTSRITGDGKFLDKQVFTLTPTVGGHCTIEACSRSQVFSILDFGTNYCNLKMLYCGSRDGCKPVLHDFEVQDETTEEFSQASVEPSSCFSDSVFPMGAFFAAMA